MFPHRPNGLSDPRLHCPQGPIETTGDFRVGHPLAIAEIQDPPLVRREPGHGLTEHGRSIESLELHSEANGGRHDIRAIAHMPSARGGAELALAEAQSGLGNRSEAIGVLRTLAARDPEMRAGKLAKLRLLHPGPSPIWKPLP